MVSAHDVVELTSVGSASKVTMSDVDVKELGELAAPMDHGTSTLGDRGTLLGTMVSLLLSKQSSMPAGQVGMADTTPERPCVIPCIGVDIDGHFELELDLRNRNEGDINQGQKK